MGKGDRKGGRPRKSVPRTASGRPSRAKPVDLDGVESAAFENGPMQTVLQARRRHMGIASDGPVSKQEADRLSLRHRGDVLGRMRTDGQITAEQESAGRTYADAWARYVATQGLPRGVPSAPAYGAVRGASADPDQDDVESARRRYKALAGALKGNVIREAVDAVTKRDMPAPAWIVRIGLAALVRELS